MDTQHCDACGAETINGQHPNTSCEPKDWAIHQARLLGQIVYLLKSATPQSGKQKGV